MLKTILLVDVDLTLIVKSNSKVYYNEELIEELKRYSADPSVEIYLFTAYVLANIWDIVRSGEAEWPILRSKVYEYLSAQGIRIAGIITIGAPLFDLATERNLGDFGNVITQFEQAAIKLFNDNYKSRPRRQHTLASRFISGVTATATQRLVRQENEDNLDFSDDEFVEDRPKYYKLRHREKTYKIPTLILSESRLELLPMVAQELEHAGRHCQYYFKGDMLKHVLEKLSCINEIKNIIVLDDRLEMTDTITALNRGALGITVNDAINVVHVWVQPPRISGLNNYSSDFPPSDLANMLSKIICCENTMVNLAIPKEEKSLGRRTRNMMNLAEAVEQEPSESQAAPLTPLHAAMAERRQQFMPQPGAVVSMIREACKEIVLQMAILKM